MNEFRFAQIGWLNASWAVLLCVALFVALEFRGRTLLDRMVSPMMQLRLVRKTSLFRRLAGISLFGLCLMAMVFALMRPQWGMSVQQLTRVESQIMICLDVSKSMLAEDVVPNRLERAKEEINSLLGLMDEGQQVGLTAFAGKASVMCPMTTDFGFLRLILQEVQPASVGLGGTRIGEAIQKAVFGFRATGDVNRLILLITDGEDHDSFPLDAAEAAKEKGVRIVSIGFGDEAGSKIEVTDPNTGVRSFVKDRNGVDVVSSLDGETLRDIAIRTEGAYIPAGTGALDLQSIYDTHIRTLLTGSDTQEERVVRNEAYQWCVLAALILFVSSLIVPNAFTNSARTRGPVAAAGLIPLVVFTWILVVVPGNSVIAQEPPSLDQAGSPASAASASENSMPAKSAPGESELPILDEADKSDSGLADSPNEEAELEPREIYNRAVRFISSDADRAERMLTEARQKAGVDGELRFRTLYNLGWVEVNRAEELVESAPADALQRFELAASRFRESIRVRPESEEARHNLEIISKRILRLRDLLAKRDPQDLVQRLDALINAQRAHQAELQAQTARTGAVDPNDSGNRSLFRQLGVTQRQILSEMQKLAEDARQEATALEKQPDDEQNGDSQFRAAQLAAMLGHLENSVQRMSKSRSFTRRMQSERAFVRWAAALSDSKRARDQLRNPVEVLGVLISDASEIAQQTQQLAASESLSLEPSQVQAPKWLSTDYLTESQATMSQRTSELRDILAAVNSQEQENADPQTAKMLAGIRESLPFIETAVTEFGQAQKQIEGSKLSSAFESQSKAIVALMDAAEYFFDLRRLIEAMYRDQRMIQVMVNQLSAEGDASFLSATGDMQAKNLNRSSRLEQMLEAELLQLAQSNPTTDDTSLSLSGPRAGSQQPSPEQRQALNQRFELAKQILAAARTSMQNISQSLSQAVQDQETSVTERSTQVVTEVNAPPTVEELLDNQEVEPPSTAEMPNSAAAAVVSDETESGSIENKVEGTDAAADSVASVLSTADVDTAVERIEDLRRLFFSVVEHLRETAERQGELNDSVMQQAAGTTSAGPGPLLSRQMQLQKISSEIAGALDEQSTQASNSATDESQASSTDQQPPAQDAETLAQAATLVREGSESMQFAVESLQELVQASAEEAQEDAVSTDLPSSAAVDDDADADAPSTDVEASHDPAASYTSVIEPQRDALQKLVEALALLDDRQAGQDQNQQQNQQQDQPDQQNQQQNEDASQPQQNMNAAQMLQAIRDREAQRRREKNQRNLSSAGGVEKDW